MKDPKKHLPAHLHNAFDGLTERLRAYTAENVGDGKRWTAADIESGAVAMAEIIKAFFIQELLFHEKLAKDNELKQRICADVWKEVKDK